jgi:uncharacterized protein YbjQ (UPF0145 family)
MTLLKPACSLIAAALVAFPGAIASAQQGRPEAPPIRIYEAAELTLAGYTVVKRIWAGTWYGSFMVPNHTDLPSAIEALKSRAADAGADGVVNLHCLNDAAWDGRYFCYGLAIRVKQPAELIPPKAPTTGD